MEPASDYTCFLRLLPGHDKIADPSEAGSAVDDLKTGAFHCLIKFTMVMRPENTLALHLADISVLAAHFFSLLQNRLGFRSAKCRVIRVRITSLRRPIGKFLLKTKYELSHRRYF